MGAGVAVFDGNVIGKPAEGLENARVALGATRLQTDCDVERKLVAPVRAKAVQKGFGSLPAFGLFAGGKRECWMWKNANGDNFTFHHRGADVLCALRVSLVNPKAKVLFMPVCDLKRRHPSTGLRKYLTPEV